MRIASKTAVAAASIVGSGLVGGLTYAAVSSPVAAAPATPRVAAPQLATQSTSPTQQRLHPRLHRMFNRLEHGELTFRTATGDRTVDLQRGVVTAVSPSSLSVRSPDGYAATYDVTDHTRVRTRAGLVSISTVHTGDRVFVVSSAGKAMRVVIPRVR